MTTERHERAAFWRSPAGLTLVVFLVVGAVYLLLEHSAHVLGVWPLLVILPCLFMHLFMHKGHGGGHGHGGGGDER